MKRFVNFMIFLGLWIASLVLIATYSGGIPDDAIKTSILAIIALVPPLVLVGLVMSILSLVGKN